MRCYQCNREIDNAYERLLWMPRKGAYHAVFCEYRHFLAYLKRTGALRMKHYEKPVLTTEMLDTSVPRQILLTGTVMGKRWVIMAGGIGDWAAYSSSNASDPRYVADYGDKMSLRDICELVDCEEVKDRWRN